MWIVKMNLYNNTNENHSVLIIILGDRAINVVDSVLK